MLNTDPIQASTTVPCMAEPGRKTRIDFDKVTAAVHEAMRKTLPGKYTPALADAIAADMATHLDAAPTPCPDNIAWCLGDPVNHTDDDDHRHQGAEHTLNGSYLCDPGTEGIATFYLAKWRDSQPHLVFQGTGLWADIDLEQTRELKRDLTAHLIRLNAVERHLAILLNPGKTPFEETDDEQLSSGAVGVALDAIQVALEKSGDRAMTLRALRNFLDMAEDEQA